MLNINYMFQCGSEDQEQVFEWMIHTVTRTSDNQANGSLLEQFILAVSKVRADCGTLGICSPLGPQDKTIYWDKLRTTMRPPLASQETKYLTLRVDACVSVIKNVLGKQFIVAQIHDAVKSCQWAEHGRAPFYNTGTQPWPITKSVWDDVTMQHQVVPLPELEVAPGICERMRCVFFELSEFDRIVNDAQRNCTHDVDYKSIIVTSANPKCEPYTFWGTVCGYSNAENGWFGYRVLSHCTFGKYCGISNLLNIGSSTSDCELKLEVEERNKMEGFGSIEKLYSPASLRSWFGYTLPVHDSLPSGLVKIPFTSRDSEFDDEIGDPRGYPDTPPSSPIAARTPGTEKYTEKTQSRTEDLGEDDKQSSGFGDAPPTGGNPGSSPLKDVSDGRERSPRASPAERAAKRPRSAASLVIDDDTDDAEEAKENYDNTQVCNFPALLTERMII